MTAKYRNLGRALTALLIRIETLTEENKELPGVDIESRMGSVTAQMHAILEVTQMMGNQSKRLNYADGGIKRSQTFKKKRKQ